VERAVQNGKVEALRPFKNTTLADVQKSLFRWRNWHNFHRKHMGIENRQPAELFHLYHAWYGSQFLTDFLEKDFAGFTT
jgi:transposase InsO family protein